MKFRKGLMVFSFLFLFLLGLTGCAGGTDIRNQAPTFKVEEQTSKFFVNDFADLLTDEQEAEMMRKAEMLESDYNGVQVVVSTVKSLKGHSDKEYARAMYNQYQIGKDSMGALVLFASEDRRVFIATGINMEGYITDSAAGKILDDYGMAYFKANDFPPGIIAVQDGLISKIEEVVPKDWNSSVTVEEKDSESEATSEETTVISKELAADNQEKTSDNPISKFLLLIAAIIFFPITLIIFAIKKFKDYVAGKVEEKQDEMQEEIDRLKEAQTSETIRINSKHNQQIELKNIALTEKYGIILELEQRNSALRGQLDAANEKYRRIKVLHPSIEAEVEEMIQNEFKAEAADFDKEAKPLVAVQPERMDVARFNNITRRYYQNLSEGAKKYVTTDISVLNSHLKTAQRLQREYEAEQKRIADQAKADSARSEITRKLSQYSKGDHSNYNAIAEIYAIYTALTSDQKGYFNDTNLVSRMENMHRNAKRDYDYYTEGQNVEQSLKRTLSSVGYADRHDVDKLKRAKREYENLSSEAKQYVSSSVYEEIRRKLRQAEDDEASYRRRQSSSSSSSYHHSGSSSFGGGSHFGGGGFSGGGGAGRGF